MRVLSSWSLVATIGVCGAALLDSGRVSDVGLCALACVAAVCSGLLAIGK